jgi:4-amino-4-deoxy-L-arabinose transferase-like glycosyltransferase
MNPVISNEVMVGLTLPLAVYFIMRFAGRDRPIQWWHGIVLGVLCALAVMSKYSGFIALILLGLVMAYHILIGPGPRPWLGASIALLIIVLASGWFYWRNWHDFGTPIPGNYTETSGFHYEQPPGMRDVRFYLRGLLDGDVFRRDLTNSMFYSFWGGMYATLWSEAHRYTFLAPRNDPALIRELIVLGGGGILLTIAFVAGSLIALCRIVRDGFRQPLTAIVGFALITLWALVLYTMKIPFYSTIKAWFALCLLPAAAVLTGIGLKAMAHNLGYARVVLYLYLAVFCGLVAWQFWYLP